MHIGNLMKQKLFAVVFIAIILILSFLSYKSHIDLNKRSNSMNNLNNSSSKIHIESKEKRTESILKPKNSLINESMYTKQQILEAQNFISEMKDKYTKLSFDIDFKNKILGLYNKNKSTALLLKNIILDHDFALKLASDDQNYARIFAIRGLKEIAISGNNEPLISTIQDFSRLVQIKNSSSKGELADLDDLLRSYISINDMDKFTENLEKHLVTTGFHKSIKNKEIFDTYDQAFYFSLSSKIGREKAKELLNKYFGS
jgi:hypothetical protein